MALAAVFTKQYVTILLGYNNYDLNTANKIFFIIRKYGVMPRKK
jgi:hypothetical protein